MRAPRMRLRSSEPPAASLVCPDADNRLGDGLFFVLVGIAVGAALLTTRVDGTLMVSATFTAAMVAVAFLGPAAAFAIVAIAELVEWAVERYRPDSAGDEHRRHRAPNLIAATIFAAYLRRLGHDVPFAAALALLAIGCARDQLRLRQHDPGAARRPAAAPVAASAARADPAARAQRRTDRRRSPRSTRSRRWRRSASPR